MNINKETEMSKHKYGNPTLGMDSRFLREFLGYDVLFEAFKQYHCVDKDRFPVIEKDSFRRRLDRFCNEIGTKSEPIKDYKDYKITNNIIFILAASFFEKLENEFKLPYEYQTYILKFFKDIYDGIKQYCYGKVQNEYLHPSACETKQIVMFLIVQGMGLFICNLQTAYGKEHVATMVENYLNNSVYDDFITKKGKNCLKNLKTSEKVLKTIKSGNKFLNWEDVKAFLGYCPSELKIHAISRYLFINLEHSLKKVFLFNDEDCYFFKQNLQELVEKKEDWKCFYEHLLGQFIEKYKDPFSSEESTHIMTVHNLIIHQHCYKNAAFKLDEFLLDLNENLPITGKFFIPWFKAYISVAKMDFEAALDYFSEAFYNKYFAGDYLKEFLEMAFCCANYYEADWTTTRKSLTKEDNIINPIRCDAKMFLNFGYAVDLFPKDAADAYLEAYNPQEYFYTIYPIECFIDEEAAQKEMKKDFENRSIKIETDGREEDVFLREHPYEVLSKLTGKKRETLIPEKSLFTLNSEHNSKQKELYAPLALCLKYGERDYRLLELAEKWISEKKFNTSLVSYNGLNALCEALIIYKNLQFRILSDNNYGISEGVILKDLDKYKRLIELLVEKTSYEKDLIYGEKIPVLKFAIECFHFDWVKRLSDKIPDKEFQGYKVDSHVTPLIYTICRKEPVNIGLVEFIRKQKDWDIPHNLANYEFGLTREEKEHNSYFSKNEEYRLYYHMNHWKDILTDDDKDNFLDMYGSEKSWSIQVAELDRMIDYFIYRTKNIDQFRTVQRASDGSMMMFSALMYAAESNDVETCRKLLKKKARTDGDKVEFGVYYSKFGEVPYIVKFNFLNVLIEYKSWDTLEMFLTEYKDLANHSMGVDEYDMTSFMHFAIKVHEDLIWCAKEKRNIMPIIELMKPLFLDCGADSNLQTKLGKVSDLLADTTATL